MKKGLLVVFNSKILLLSVFLMVVYCGKSQIITENFEGADWVGGLYSASTTVLGATANPTSAKSSSFYMSTISVLSTNVTTGNSAVRSGTRAIQLQATSASFIITPIIKGGVTVLKAWVRPNNNGTAGCRFAIGYATNTSILTSTSSGSLASQIGTTFVWSSASTGAFPVTSSTWGAWSGNTYGMTHTNSTSAAVSSTINGGTNLTPSVYQQLTLTMNATGDAFFKFQRMGAGMFIIDDIEIINVLKPTATAATSVTSTTATANWNAASGADSYKLNVARYNASEPFISEYVEGSSNNKYIEIFNPTPNSIDLSGYTLRLYSNGASTVTTETALSGTLVSGGTAVFKNGSATVYGGTATTNSAVNFTGDDAIVLYKTSSASNIDIFGRIGEQPSTGWSSNNFITADRTLVRKKQ